MAAGIPRQLRNGVIGALVMMALAGGYVGVMNSLDRAPLLNAEVVEPGWLIRSAQPGVGDLARLKEEEGLGTIICLRGKEERKVAEWAAANGVKVISLQLWSKLPPREEQVGIFFDIMRGATVELSRYQDVILETVNVDRPALRFPLPVLLHCESGADRTGVMVALYRIAFQGFTVEHAKREMTLHFHLSFRRPALFQYLTDVAPRLSREFGHRGPPPLPGNQTPAVINSEDQPRGAAGEKTSPPPPPETKDVH